MKANWIILAAAVIAPGVVFGQATRQVPPSQPYNVYQPPAPHQPPAGPAPYPSPSQYGTAPAPGSGVYNPYQSACATGFNKVPGSGASYSCVTPVISCPAAQGGMGGGLANPQGHFISPGHTAQFRYDCSYGPTPR